MILVPGKIPWLSLPGFLMLGRGLRNLKGICCSRTYPKRVRSPCMLFFLVRPTSGVGWVEKSLLRAFEGLGGEVLEGLEWRGWWSCQFLSRSRNFNPYVPQGSAIFEGGFIGKGMPRGSQN